MRATTAGRPPVTVATAGTAHAAAAAMQIIGTDSEPESTWTRTSCPSPGESITARLSVAPAVQVHWQDSHGCPTRRAKSLLKILRIVENERFTFEIDSEIAILDCTLER